MVQSRSSKDLVKRLANDFRDLATALASTLDRLSTQTEVDESVTQAALARVRLLQQWTLSAAEAVHDQYLNDRGTPFVEYKPSSSTLFRPVAHPDELPTALRHLVALGEDDLVWDEIGNDVDVELVPILDIVANACNRRDEMSDLATVGRLAVRSFGRHRDLLPTDMAIAVEAVARCLG